MDDHDNEFRQTQDALDQVTQNALRRFPDLWDRMEVHYVLRPDGSAAIDSLTDSHLIQLRAALALIRSGPPSDLAWNLDGLIRAVEEELVRRGLSS